MPRKPVIYCSENPYHIVARSNNKDWFEIPMDYCYGIYINILSSCIDRFKIELHAFVLMNNHLHMIVSTPNENISEFLRHFMTESSKGISYKRHKINHMYGGRNHKTLITNPEYYAHCLKYILRNPIRANMCDNVELYEWSSISKYPSKIKRLITPAGNGHEKYLPTKYSELLEWLNDKPPRNFDEACRKALRRSTFQFKTCSSSQKMPASDSLLPGKVPGT